MHGADKRPPVVGIHRFCRLFNRGNLSSPPAGGSPAVPRPLIGLTSYATRAAWGVWDVDTTLLPQRYVEAVVEALLGHQSGFVRTPKHGVRAAGESVARRRYIQAVQDFNNLVTVPPTSFTNSLLYHHAPKAQFAATTPGAAEAPRSRSPGPSSRRTTSRGF